MKLDAEETCLSIEREARYSCDAPMAAKSLKSSQECQKSLFAFALKKGSWKTMFSNNNVLKSLLAPQWRPRAPQSGPRAAKNGPRAPQERPRAAQKRPKVSQERPKTHQ